MLNKAFTPLARHPGIVTIHRQVCTIFTSVKCTPSNNCAGVISATLSGTRARIATPTILSRKSIVRHFSSNITPLRSTGSSGSSYSRNSYKHFLFASATAIATLTPTDEDSNVPNNHVLVPVSGSKTREEGLYLASQQDQELTARGLNRQNPSTIYLWYKKIARWFYYHCYNPVRTCFRFIHLMALFGPVILTLPLVTVGPKVVSAIYRTDGIVEESNSPPTKDRIGAIWWYKYLTWTMEIAGPSFIKVRNNKISSFFPVGNLYILNSDQPLTHNFF